MVVEVLPELQAASETENEGSVTGGSPARQIPSTIDSVDA